MEKCNLVFILSLLGTAAGMIGVIYAFLRNFKTDINAHIDRLEKRMDGFERRMDNFDRKFEAHERKMISLEERMFWAITGKKLEDAILEQRQKNSE